MLDHYFGRAYSQGFYVFTNLYAYGRRESASRRRVSKRDLKAQWMAPNEELFRRSWRNVLNYVYLSCMHTGVFFGDPFEIRAAYFVKWASFKLSYSR